jgi:hypothetical protein
MGYAPFLFEICPVGNSSGGTSALLEGVCGMCIQLHAFRRAAAPQLNFHGFRNYVHSATFLLEKGCILSILQ